MGWLLSLPKRMWAANGVGAAAMWIQAIMILLTRKVDGISVPSFVMFAIIQATFTEHGWKSGTWSLFWGQLLSLLATLTVITLTLYFRR